MLNPELHLQIAQPVTNFCAISDVESPLLSFLFERSVTELSHPSLTFCQTFLKNTLSGMNVSMTNLDCVYVIS